MQRRYRRRCDDICHGYWCRHWAGTPKQIRCTRTHTWGSRHHSDVSLPAPLLRIVNVNINVVNLNAITERICAARSGITFVPVTPPAGSALVPLASRTYEHWARELTPAIAMHLAHVAIPPPPGTTAIQKYTVFDSSALRTQPVSVALKKIMHSARLLLNTSGAAITFHNKPAHWFTSTSGVGDMHRDEAGIFCSAAFTARGSYFVKTRFTMRASPIIRG